MKRAIVLAAIAVVLVVVEEIFAAFMVHRAVAASLLAAPSVGVAIVAVLFVVIRVAAIVLGPGFLFAAIASLAAHSLTRSGASISVGAGAGTRADRLE